MALPADLGLTRLDGTPIEPTRFVGRPLLVVNVASQCGLTPQYAGLQSLFEAHRADGLVVLGVPCNQFGAQEPGSAEQIAAFCDSEYGVTFPLLTKQDVNGPGRSALYRWLIDSPAGGGRDVTWNFEKFLVDRTGAVVARFDPSTPPDDPALRAAVIAALED